MNATLIIAVLVAFLAGGAAAFLILRKMASAKMLSAKEKSTRLIDDMRRQAESKLKEAEIEARELVFKAKGDFERDMKQQREELIQFEKRLLRREENIDKKAEFLENKDSDLKRRDRAVQAAEQKGKEKEKECADLAKKLQAHLEKAARMTTEEAKAALIETIEAETRLDAQKMVKQIEEDAREKAEEEAKKIIATAIQRYAGEYVAEHTVSVVQLPNDEMKGRIIGREGRNIRAIEAATGVDLIVDDTPEAVIISGFSPLRREIARLSLEKLVADGRIHPARIEEIVQKTETELDAKIKDAGESACFDLGLHGIHPELIKLIGRLKYRTSYSQNQWQHSMEVAFICGVMAVELGLNVKQAKRAGVLHDIGKALDHEVEGSHAVIGADAAKKYGESPKIVHAIKAHHEEEKPETVLAVLVQAADALSGARPGARREMYETYVKRIEDLEAIGKSFPGVERVYAIQAGREIRVIVENTRVPDDGVANLAKDIARKIETSLSYPGHIKITVIRETRGVEVAK